MGGALMSTISSNIGSLVSSADGTGNLVLQTNGATTVITLNTSQAIGVGSTPSYGTAGQILTSAGSSAAPSWSGISGGTF
jgi:hypothetical protein